MSKDFGSKNNVFPISGVEFSLSEDYLGLGSEYIPAVYDLFGEPIGESIRDPIDKYCSGESSLGSFLLLGRFHRRNEDRTVVSVGLYREKVGDVDPDANRIEIGRLLQLFRVDTLNDKQLLSCKMDDIELPALILPFNRSASSSALVREEIFSRIELVSDSVPEELEEPSLSCVNIMILEHAVKGNYLKNSR